MSFRPRVLASRAMVRVGRFVQYLALMIIRPDDLIEFGRRTYSEPRDVDSWAAEKLVDPGLLDDEKALVDSLPLRQGNLLVLGRGAAGTPSRWPRWDSGSRESILFRRWFAGPRRTPFGWAFP